MPVIAVGRQIFKGIRTSIIGVPIVLIEITPKPDFYIIEGYLDTSAMEEGDTLVIREFMKVDATTYRKFADEVYKGKQENPILRFYSKQFQDAYKIELTQITGQPRNFPYWFVLLEEGVV